MMHHAPATPVQRRELRSIRHDLSANGSTLRRVRPHATEWLSAASGSAQSVRHSRTSESDVRYDWAAAYAGGTILISFVEVVTETNAQIAGTDPSAAGSGTTVKFSHVVCAPDQGNCATRSIKANRDGPGG